MQIIAEYETLVYLLDSEEYNPRDFSKYYIGTIKQASSQIIHPAIGPIVCLASIEDATRLLVNTHDRWLDSINVKRPDCYVIVIE